MPRPFDVLLQKPDEDIDTYGATMGGKGPLANLKRKPLPKPTPLPATTSEEKTMRDAMANRR